MIVLRNPADLQRRQRVLELYQVLGNRIYLSVADNAVTDKKRAGD